MTTTMSPVQALDRVLDDLERRLDRREKRLRSAEDSVVAQRRAGPVDPRSVASYKVECARYDELRLAFNAALRIAKATRS